MPTPSDWRRRLDVEPFGKQWLAHFEFDIKCGNIPAELSERFSQAIDQALQKGIPDPTEESPAPVLTLICGILNRSDDFNLSGIRTPGDIAHCCRVMDIDAFSEFHAKRFCDEELGAETAETQRGSTLWQYFEELTPEWYEGELMTLRPFFWAALKQRVDEIENSSAGNQATNVRNYLGLDMGENKRLVRIEIPQSLLVGKRVCAPTTLDAGMSKFFIPADDPKGFGWTLHLETLERGAEELVIEKIAFTSECTVRKLGIVSSTVPELEWDETNGRFRKRETNP